MPTVLSRSVASADDRTVVGSMSFDGVVADWPSAIRAALAEVPALTTTSIDSRQAFVVHRRKFAAGAGMQLEFTDGPRGSELRARAHGPSGVHVGIAGSAAASASVGASWLAAPGIGAMRALFDAIAAAVASD